MRPLSLHCRLLLDFQGRQALKDGVAVGPIDGDGPAGDRDQNPDHRAAKPWPIGHYPAFLSYPRSN